MKKTGRFRVFMVAAALLGLLVLGAVPASAAIANGQYRMTSSALNLRTSASTSSSVVTVIPKNKFVKITANAGDNWYKIAYGTKKGYVSGTYLKDPFTLHGNKYTKIMATAINLRTAPNQTSAKKIMVVPTGAKVFLISKVKNVNWYRIYYNGRIGYIIGGYFTTGDTANTKTLAKNIYLRSSAGISSGNIITIIKAGSKVTIISKYNSKWYKVRYGTKTGYIAAGYFTTDSSSSGSAANTRTVRTALNLRRSRSTSSDNILRTIPQGGRVTVLGSYSGNWYKVTYAGTTGYIKGGYFV